MPYPAKSFKWWYVAIADWMLSNPDAPLYECANALKKAPNTIYMIAKSDLFRAYLAQRRSDFEKHHDGVLRQKLTAVAESSLDILLSTLEKKRDHVPIGQLTDVAMGTLDRLGYSPNKTAAASVQVNVQQVAAVSPAALEEARAALRRAEEKRRDTPLLDILPAPPVALSRSEAELPPLELEAEDDDAPLTVSSE